MMILLKLLGIGKWLKTLAQKALEMIGRYPLQTALIVALCLAGWQWRGKQHALANLAAEKAAHAASIAQCKAASDANRAAQLAQKAALDAKYTDLKGKADDALRALDKTAGDLARAYIAANRVRPERVRISTPGGPGEGQVAGSSEGPGPEAELVSVTADDVMICTENTVRLESLVGWADGLKREGVGE